MTFVEWWAENTHKFEALDQAIDIAKQAWHVAETATREELLTQFNRTGVDIDAALHGRVNEQSPIANRLRMIAAAQPQWRPIGEHADDTTVGYRGTIPGYLILYAPGREPDGHYRYAVVNGKYVNAHAAEEGISHWMPLPPPPEKTK